MRDWYARNRERVLVAQSQRHAANPEKRRTRDKAWRKKNPGRSYDQIKAWAVANPDRVREYKKAWKQRNPDVVRNYRALRRAREAGASVGGPVDRLAIYDRDGGRCHLCGGRCSRNDFHIDHLVPISAGGEHSPANVAVAHPRCNLSRGAGRSPAQLRLGF